MYNDVTKLQKMLEEYDIVEAKLSEIYHKTGRGEYSWNNIKKYQKYNETEEEHIKYEKQLIAIKELIAAEKLLAKAQEEFKEYELKQLNKKN